MHIIYMDSYNISRGAQYVTLQKKNSHTSLVINIFLQPLSLKRGAHLSMHMFSHQRKILPLNIQCIYIARLEHTID
jgi:hypothetical protein